MEMFVFEDEEPYTPAPKPTVSDFTRAQFPMARTLLTRHEELDLAVRAQGGCERSRDRMVEANIRLVVSVARRYTCRSMTLEDLVQEGIIGLFEAIQKFDTGMGYKFSTYATYWIRQAIVRAIEKQDRMIRLPAYGCNAERKVSQAYVNLKKILGRDATIAEIAEATGLSQRLVEALRVMGPEPMSLDAMVGEDADTPLGDLLIDEEACEPEDDCIRQADSDILLAVLEKLPERERMVIKRRFGIGYEGIASLREIANDLKMSREGVRHMQNRTLKRLRKMLRTEATLDSLRPRRLEHDSHV
jgi:RNA polymerase primary sigma factor